MQSVSKPWYWLSQSAGRPQISEQISFHQVHRLLAQDSELYVVGEVSEPETSLLEAHDTRPDLVLLDWELSDFLAYDLILSLHSLRRPPTVVAFGERSETRGAALAAGADAYVCRDEPTEWLLGTLHKSGKLSPFALA